MLCIKNPVYALKILCMHYISCEPLCIINPVNAQQLFVLLHSDVTEINKIKIPLKPCLSSSPSKSGNLQVEKENKENPTPTL